MKSAENIWMWINDIWYIWYVYENNVPPMNIIIEMAMITIYGK